MKIFSIIEDYLVVEGARLKKLRRKLSEKNLTDKERFWKHAEETAGEIERWPTWRKEASKLEPSKRYDKYEGPDHSQ